MTFEEFEQTCRAWNTGYTQEEIERGYIYMTGGEIKCY